jgi:hypothetical protein
MKKMKASISALVFVMTIGVVTPSFAAPSPSVNTISSTSIQPLSAQGCSGDVCIYLSTPSSGTVYVQGWAYTANFYGHFQFSAPSGTFNSATLTWLTGKGNYAQLSNVPAIVGTYSVTAWTSAGANLGTACEKVL